MEELYLPLTEVAFSRDDQCELPLLPQAILNMSANLEVGFSLYPESCYWYWQDLLVLGDALINNSEIIKKKSQIYLESIFSHMR